jgi:tripeptide aminopeptidase
MNLPPVTERFLRYVRIDTQSVEDAPSYPSTEKQKDLCRLLVDELRALGLHGAAMCSHGHVYASVESNVPWPVPAIGLLAHVDTSPEVSGTNVHPIVHREYEGGPLELGPGVTLSPDDSPELLEMRGRTLITTDGRTLLGADDKAGIAAIMTSIERLRDDPDIPHGRICIAFTCDEEVGRGTEHFDLERFGAKYAYTVDGEGAGEIENETFCADAATVAVTGVSVHPGQAKGKLVNAMKVAAAFLAGLPPDALSPETTEGREGFVHPTGMEGNVETAKVKLIVRDFDEEGLAAHRELLVGLASEVQQAFPGSTVEVKFTETYRNMRFVLDEHPDVVDAALEAVRRVGLEPKLCAIRGGTDGSRLSYKGLPTPNIFAGGHLFHSRKEWIAVEDMDLAVETLVHLVRIWAERSAPE